MTDVWTTFDIAKKKAETCNMICDEVGRMPPRLREAILDELEHACKGVVSTFFDNLTAKAMSELYPKK